MKHVVEGRESYGSSYWSIDLVDLFDPGYLSDSQEKSFDGRHGNFCNLFAGYCADCNIVYETDSPDGIRQQFLRGK
jgi:hypothetical protein